MEFLTHPAALGASALAAMRHWVERSRYVGDSPLRGTFRASRGFAMTFTRDGMGQVARRFPELWPFLERALDPRSWRRLFGPIGQLWPPRPNAFYLNLLVVPPGAAVGPHVDATLSWVTGREAVTPRIVSVLYIEVGSGGRLRLARGERRVAEIVPVEGSMLHFRGELGHEVTAVEGDGARISLVCEQYVLAASAVARLEPMQVTSRGLFERYLEAAKGKARNVVLDS